jgi:hypothetical protein
MRDAFESKALKALWLEEREHVRKSIAKQQVSRVFTAPTLCCAVLCCAVLCCAVLCCGCAAAKRRLVSRADWVWCAKSCRPN